jgi:hypothetical protein
MKPNTKEEKQRMSSKATFVAAIVFFAIAWGRSLIFPTSPGSDSFVTFWTVIHIFLGICALLIGINLHVRGGHASNPPSRRHLVWSIVAVFVIAVIGGAVVYFQR